MMVETFWTGHTVRDAPFGSAQESLDHLERRSSDYPLFRELMGLWGDHRNDVVLDYGCGPANDLVGFAVYGKAKRLIGADVSQTALSLARRRLDLHGVNATLLKVSDDVPALPLPSESVDYIYCEGVLHHVSHPDLILAEFHRVLRPGGTAAIMVYNYESLYLHLYVAYQRQILEGFAPGPVEEAFRRTTDRASAPPISVPYRPADFAAMCRAAGFTVDFGGGYYAALELELFRTIGADAIADGRLAAEHRDFLSGLRMSKGYPMHDGLPVGIGGVYQLSR
jgi:SAM-dependent methyltransferase